MGIITILLAILVYYAYGFDYPAKIYKTDGKSITVKSLVGDTIYLGSGNYLYTPEYYIECSKGTYSFGTIKEIVFTRIEKYITSIDASDKEFDTEVMKGTIKTKTGKLIDCEYQVQTSSLFINSYNGIDVRDIKRIVIGS